MLHALLGDAPGLELLKQMLRRRGNPFFLEETVRTLVETKALEGERGAYRLVRPVQSLQIPATVQAILAARIDRLLAEEKRLLQTASVIGKDVPWAILTAIAELPEEALRRALGHLQEAEFLYETALFPDLQYTFKHALTHEVTYGSLLQDRRRTFHGRIVEAIEQLYGDRLTEHIERLAHHASRGEAWEKAVTYLRQAGAKAFARSANREALAYFEQALTALTHLPETRERLEQAIDVRFELRGALFPLAEFESIEECLREAETLARRLDDQRRLGWVSAYMCSYHAGTGGRATEQLSFARRVEAIGGTLGDVSLEVAAQYYLLMACHTSGDYPGSEHASRRMMQMLQGDRSRERFGLAAFTAVLSRAHLARSLAERGVFDEGAAHGREALRIAEALDHPLSLVDARLGLAYVSSVRGDLSEAGRLLEPVVAQCHDWSIMYFAPLAMASLGYVYVWSGRIVEGVFWLQQALTAHEAARIGYLHSMSVVQLGEAYLLASQVENARASGDRALMLARERGERGHEAWARRLLGDVASHQSTLDVATAAAHFGAAMTLAAELGMRPLVAHCHLGLGKLYRRTGKRQEAEQHISTATTMYREMDMLFWLEQAEVEMRYLS